MSRSSYTVIYNAAGSAIVGGVYYDEQDPKSVALPGINNYVQNLLTLPVLRRGQWISREGLPCADPDITEDEASMFCAVRPHHTRLPRVKRAGKYYSEY